MSFKIVGGLVRPEQIRVEQVIAKIEVDCSPVGKRQSIAHSRVDREQVIVTETGAADATDQIQRRIVGRRRLTGPVTRPG